jgi:hypothetical protein
MADKNGDCYIDVWRDADFRGEKLRVYGPAQYPTLELTEGNWCNDIRSLRVGPNAFILAYHRRDFQDEPVTFGPNDEVADLVHFKLDNDIESLNVIDSLKIFDRLPYNAVPGAPAPADTEPLPDPDKGKRRKGKRG